MKSVSRNFPKTIASELVEVKPMGFPIGKLFYFDAVYKEPNEKLKIPTLRGPELKPIKL
jgi:hypothetical protein